MSTLYRICRIAGLIMLCICTQQPCLGQNPLDVDDFPAGAADRQSLPSERVYRYDFTDVQVSQIEGWLRWLGYELPVDVSGQVSGWLWAQRSARGWLNFSDYRVEGEIDSPQLLVDSWIVDQASLRFGYIDGVWYVGRLSGRLSKQAHADQRPRQAIGQAELRASLPMAAPRLLRTAGRIDHILLQPLLDAFDLTSGNNIDIKNQPGSLAFSGQVPLAAAANIEQWKLTGDIAVDGIRLQTTDAANLPELSLSSAVRLESGQWTIPQAQIGVAEQMLEVDARGDLKDSRLPYTINLAGQNVELAALISAFNPPHVGPSENLPMVQGVAALDGRITGSAGDGLESATFNVRAAEILAAGEKFSTVRLMASLPVVAGIPQGMELRLQRADLAGGKLRGLLTWSSMAELANGLPSQAALDFEQFELGSLDAVDLPMALRGKADGQLRLHIDPRQPARDWSGEARLRIRSLIAGDNPLGDAYLSFSKTAQTPQIEFSVRDGRQTFAMQGTCGLEDVDDASRFRVNLSDYTVRGVLRDYHTQLSLSEALGEGFALVPVAASGQFQLAGELDALRGNSNDRWPSHGSLELNSLSIALDEQTYHLQHSLLNIRPDALRIERFRLVNTRPTSRRPASGLSPDGDVSLDSVGTEASATDSSLPQGRVVGSALIRRDAQGEHLLNLRVAEMQVRPYVVNFAPQELQGLSGQVKLETRLKKSANEPWSIAGWQGQFTGQLQNISFRDVPLSNLAFNGQLQPERLVIQADGSLFGGELDAKADVSTRQLGLLLNPQTVSQALTQPTQSSPEYELEFALKAAQLNRLMSTIFGRRAAAPYAGTADFQINASSPADGSPLVAASLQIPNFNFERKSLAQNLQATLRYRDGNLLIDSLDGGIAGGRIEVAGALREDAGGSLVGDLRFSAEQLQVAAMTAWVAPGQVHRYSGTFNYNGRALLGRELQLTGAARLSDALLSGYEIQSLRGHMNVWLDRSGRLHEVSTRSMTGKALGGTARGSARLHGDTRYGFTSNFQIANGKLDQLSRALGFEHIVGSGSFDAQAALRSNDAGRLNALAGPLRLDFQSGDARAVPLLADLSRLLPVLQLSDTDINNGRLNAQFGQGQLHLLNFYLTSDAFWLAGNGTTSLATGALDISAVLNTGGGIETQIVQGASQTLIAAAIPQLLILTQLNDIVRNRTIYLRIGGRTRQPVIQPQVAPTLARALLQNVYRSLLTTPVADAAIQN